MLEKPKKGTSDFKIAIASSGLGHIKRGMEGWSKDISLGLHQRGVNVTLFKGSGEPDYKFEKVLPTFKRSSVVAKVLGKMTEKGGWRVGLGSASAVESFFFGLQLVWHLRKGYDLIHLKQGGLAQFVKRTKDMGFHNVPIVLSNGQMTSRKFLSQFDYVQHLTPCLENPTCKEIKETPLPENHFVIPNFIDVECFFKKNKEVCREKLGLPQDSQIILTVGTVKKYHKRMDYFIDEMSCLKKLTSVPLHFVIAGAKDPETSEIFKSGVKKLGSDLTVLLDVPREQMPEIYSAADVLVLCSLVEAFGTTIIEGMSCDLPVITHNYPSFEWITQGAGVNIDLKESGALAQTLAEYFQKNRHFSGFEKRGRAIVKKNFSEDAVVLKIMGMYEKIYDMEK